MNALRLPCTECRSSDHRCSPFVWIDLKSFVLIAAFGLLCLTSVFRGFGLSQLLENLSHLGVAYLGSHLCDSLFSYSFHQLWVHYVEELSTLVLVSFLGFVIRHLSSIAHSAQGSCDGGGRVRVFGKIEAKHVFSDALDVGEFYPFASNECGDRKSRSDHLADIGRLLKKIKQVHLCSPLGVGQEIDVGSDEVAQIYNFVPNLAFFGAQFLDALLSSRNLTPEKFRRQTHEE